jgi:hypothetical protein
VDHLLHVTKLSEKNKLKPKINIRDKIKTFERESELKSKKLEKLRVLVLLRFHIALCSKISLFDFVKWDCHFCYNSWISPVSKLGGHPQLINNKDHYFTLNFILEAQPCCTSLSHTTPPSITNQLNPRDQFNMWSIPWIHRAIVTR